MRKLIAVVFLMFAIPSAQAAEAKRAHAKAHQAVQKEVPKAPKKTRTNKEAERKRAIPPIRRSTLPPPPMDYIPAPEAVCRKEPCLGTLFVPKFLKNGPILKYHEGGSVTLEKARLLGEDKSYVVIARIHNDWSKTNSAYIAQIHSR